MSKDTFVFMGVATLNNVLQRKVEEVQNPMKKRIDIVITKSFYFTHSTGECIKIFEIPVLQAQHPLSFLIQSRLQLFIAKFKTKAPKIFVFFP